MSERGRPVVHSAAPRKTSWPLIALGLLAITGGAWLAGENLRLRSTLREERPPGVINTSSLKPGDVLPDVQLVDLPRRPDGPPVLDSLRSALDGPSALFMFTSTCYYCARSAPFARTLHEQLSALSIGFVGVALDGRLPPGGSDGPIFTYRTFALVDSAEVKDLRVSRVPTVLLIDSEFVVLNVWTGELNTSRVQEIVQFVGGLITSGK